MCALQFNPQPYLALYQQQQEEENKPRPYEQAPDRIMQGLQMLAENQRQNKLMELQKQQLAQNQTQQQLENTYKYGTPISPDVSVGVPGGQGASRLFGNQPMQVGQGSSLIDQFNKFRAGGMKAAQARPEFVGALGQEERKTFQEKFDPQRQADLEYKQSQTFKNLRESQDTGGLGKPPAGYRWTPEGNLQAIPGGPGEFKIKQATEKQEMIDKSLRDRAQLVIGKVDQALNQVSGFSSGAMAGTAGIPGVGQLTGARDLEATLDTVKAILGFEQLEQMKSQSRAGASGLGQLSDREMRLLTAARANLDQAQTPDQLRERLNEVKVHFQNWMAMEEGRNPYGQGKENGGNAGPKVGEVRKGYRFKGGNPADRNSWEKAR